MKVFICVCALGLLPAQLFAGAGLSGDLEFFSLERATLEEIINIKTSVATLNQQTLRATPGLVTIITAEEIRASGARNLVDVLTMVPEFEFGVDKFGTIGLSMRGNWGNEGKILVLWDGQIYNEPLYTSVQYDRFPVDQIEQIEIIKGPGSVIYGGYAELAVINIKTRSPKNLNGSEIYAAYGQAREKARNYAGYSFGKALEGAEISAKAFLGEAQRSDRRYSDSAGRSYSMNNASRLSPRSFNLYAKKSGLSLRLIMDRYSLTERDGVISIQDGAPEPVSFNSTMAEVKYEGRVSDKLRIESAAGDIWSEPWNITSSAFVFDKRTEQRRAAVTAFYDHSEYVAVVTGGEYTNTSVEIGPDSHRSIVYRDGSDRMAYDTSAFFGQGSVDLGVLNLTAGARYDMHSQYGDAFVPRFAATGLWDRFHLKAICSRAFRAPSIENLRVNPDIHAEKSVSYEFEAGYKAGENIHLSANLFRTLIENPIQHFTNLFVESYENRDHTGTNGFGLNVKFKKEALRADIGYLFYSALSNSAATYVVPRHTSYMLGVPRHKVVFNASMPVAPGVSLNPSAVYLSRRYGYAEGGNLRGFNDLIVSNMNLMLKDHLMKGLTLSLGVFDMFNSNYSYIQPYRSGHAPLPAQSREIFFKADYAF